MLLPPFSGFLLSQFPSLMSEAEPELEMTWVFCLFGLVIYLFVSYVKLNQIKGNLTATVTVPCPLFLVLNILFSLTSHTDRQRNSVIRVPQGDPEIKSGMEVEKSSDRKILSSFILFQLNKKQQQSKHEIHKKILTKSNSKIILFSSAFLCHPRATMLELMAYYWPRVMIMVAFSQTWILCDSGILMKYLGVYFSALVLIFLCNILSIWTQEVANVMFAGWDIWSEWL